MKIAIQFSLLVRRKQCRQSAALREGRIFRNHLASETSDGKVLKQLFAQCQAADLWNLDRFAAAERQQLQDAIYKSGAILRENTTSVACLVLQGRILDCEIQMDRQFAGRGMRECPLLPER